MNPPYSLSPPVDLYHRAPGCLHLAGVFRFFSRPAAIPVLLGLAVVPQSPGSDARPAPAIVWRNAGPGGGGWIQSIAWDPHDPQVIHVGCDVGGYYQSRDGGKTFRILNDGLTDYFVERILVHPANPNVLWLATQSGVFKSDDAGRTWHLKRRGFPPVQKYSFSAPIGPLVCDPRNPDILYAGVGRPRLCTGGRGRIYKSTDGGESWSPLVGIAKFAPRAVIHQLAIRPDDSQVLFAATDKGLFKSSDGGATWSRKQTGLPHGYCRNVVIHPRRPDFMAVVLWSTPGRKPWQGGVYISTDGGEHWTERNGGLPRKVAPEGDAWQKTCNYIRLAMDPRDPDRMYVGANSWWGAGLYRTTDGGRHWELCTRTRGEHRNTDTGWITFWGITVKCLAISPFHPHSIVFGDSGRVLRSDDGGDHWCPLYTRRVRDGWWQGNGLEVTCLHHAAVDPFDPNRILCGYADIGILVSEDGGTSWQRRVDGLGAHGDMARIVFDPDVPGKAWCCEGKPRLKRGGVAVTFDAGRSWKSLEARGLPKGAARLLTLAPASPPAARTLYVTIPGSGLFRSRDGGVGWNAVNHGFGNGPIVISALIIDPSDSRRLLAAREAPRSAPAAGGLFETVDGGEHWRKINRTPELPDIRSLTMNPRNPRVLFAACRQYYDHAGHRLYRGGIWRSEDGGRTWQCVFPDRFASCLAVDPRNPRIVLAGTTRHPYHDNPVGPGVLMSTDGGRTWHPENTGLTNRNVAFLTFDPGDPRRLLLGTGGNGLFIGTRK